MLYRALRVGVLLWVKAGQASVLNDVRSRRWRRSPRERSMAASVASSCEAASSWFQWERERRKADAVGEIGHVLQSRGQQGEWSRVSGGWKKVGSQRSHDGMLVCLRKDGHGERSKGGVGETRVVDLLEKTMSDGERRGRSRRHGSSKSWRWLSHSRSTINLGRRAQGTGHRAQGYCL